MKIQFVAPVLIWLLIGRNAHVLEFSPHQIRELDEILTAESERATPHDRGGDILGPHVPSRGLPIGFPSNHFDRNGNDGAVYTCNYKVHFNRKNGFPSTSGLDCVSIAGRDLDGAIESRRVLFADRAQCRRSCSELMSVDFEQAKQNLAASLERKESIASIQNPIIEGFKSLVKQSQKLTRFIRKNSRFESKELIRRPWVTDFTSTLQTPFGWVSKSFHERFQQDQYFFQYISMSDRNNFSYQSEERESVAVSVKDLILWGAQKGIIVRYPFISDLVIPSSGDKFLRIFVKQDANSIIVLPLYRTEWSNFFLRDFNKYSRPIITQNHNQKREACRRVLRGLEVTRLRRQHSGKWGKDYVSKAHIIPIPEQKFYRYVTEQNAHSIVRNFHEILVIARKLPIDQINRAAQTSLSTIISPSVSFETKSEVKDRTDHSPLLRDLTFLDRLSIDGNVRKYDDFGKPYY